MPKLTKWPKTEMTSFEDYYQQKFALLSSILSSFKLQIYTRYILQRYMVAPLGHTINQSYLPSLSCLKARLHRRFLSQQFNAIFVMPKLQLQNRMCKLLCDFGTILAIYHRGMRYNSRNTVTLSSIFTF